MEGYVNELVENTFKKYGVEGAKKIIVERILFYEKKIRELEEKVKEE